MPDVSSLKAFVTVGRTTSEPLGSKYAFDGVAEQETITVARLTTVSVNAYGRNAYALIEKLASCLYTSQAQMILKRAGAAVLRVSPVRNLPSAIAGGFEQRAQVDIFLTHRHRVTAAVNRVDMVEIPRPETDHKGVKP